MISLGAQANKSIVVHLGSQTATAYENGHPVFSGRISSGKRGRATPTGSFRVLEKDIDHVSTSWPKPNGGAKMHYMLRLTNYGIAMHLGRVPNYPASHGCRRLKNGFAQRMYRWANVGTPVRVVHGRGLPSDRYGSSVGFGSLSALEILNGKSSGKYHKQRKSKKRAHKKQKRRTEKKTTVLESLRV